jgi:hypothetical protein
MTEGQLSGYDTVELLGYGSGGEVWLARERTTGLPVALKRLRAGADLAARDRLRREAAVLAGVDHPHVVRLRSVHGDGDSLVLVLDLAAGGSLARLLATRRLLPAGEVVTIAVPLAQALASVHAQGLVHGDVTPANVLFAADGRPMLSDLGISRLLGTPAAEVGGTGGYLDPAAASGAAPGPASDVHGLAATCLAALTGLPPYDGQGRRVPVPGGVDRALLDVLEPALAPDPADRPSPEQLAVAFFDAVPAEPVRLESSGRVLGGTGPSTGPAAVPATHQVAARAPADEPIPPATSPRRHRRAALLVASFAGLVARVRRPGRAVAGGGLAAVALVLAVAAGLTWAAADDVTPAAGTSGRVGVATGEQRSGWASTLATLDADRSRAFAAGDPVRLREVYAADGPALRRDVAVLRRLTEAGLRAQGLRLSARDVAVQARSAGQVRLAVTDVMPAYRLVDERGAVVERRPGRGSRSWTVVLAREGAGWRVYDVVRG